MNGQMVGMVGSGLCSLLSDLHTECQLPLPAIPVIPLIMIDNSWMNDTSSRTILLMVSWAGNKDVQIACLLACCPFQKRRMQGFCRTPMERS